jgi:hypothetical protein
MAVTSTSRIEPRTPHVSDSSIQPFLQPDFDPADYLNTALPALSTSSTTARVDELRSLAEVWKGTAEEKARLKLVDALQKLVDNNARTVAVTSGVSGPSPFPRTRTHQ